MSELDRKRKDGFIIRARQLHTAIDNFAMKMSDEKRFILSFFSKRSTKKYIFEIRNYCDM